MDSQTEAAWAAGFFDGEGCTGRYRHNGVGRGGPSLRMSINQRQREPLERFQAAVGGLGTIREYLHMDRSMYQWRVQSFAGCEQVSHVLWPYLCSIKRAQYDEKAGEYRDAWDARNHSGKGYQFMTNAERAAYQREWRNRDIEKQREYQRNYQNAYRARKRAEQQQAVLFEDHAT